MSLVAYHEKLYAEFILSYEEVHANILDDIKFYITTLRGAVIYSDGYLTRNGKLPDRIDIWMDGKNTNFLSDQSFL